MQEFLIAVGVSCAIGGALALLLAIAEAFVANYGECVITINGQRKLKVQGGAPLLATLMRQSIFIPSACGGRGTCGYCKVKVLEGGGQVLPTETPYLTPAEVKSGVRLSCQCKVRNDIAIEIPESLFNVREFSAVVDKIEDLTHDMKSLTLRLIDPPEITFKAGQYVQLRSEPYAAVADRVYRAYSIASPPTVKNAIELIIRRVPSGIMTTYVFDHLKPGQPIFFNGPHGDFFLRPGAARPVFIAGGSGIAPIKSIILDNPTDVSRRNGIFFFGAVQRRDLALLDMMNDFASRQPPFKYVPALSKPAETDAWNGERGLITEVVDRFIQPGEAAEGYLCGSPGMIDACVAVLKKKGIPEDRIFYDKFS